MGQDSVKLSWKNLSGFLRTVAVDFLRRHDQGLFNSVGGDDAVSADAEPKIITRIVRGGVAHMLYDKANSQWKPGRDFQDLLYKKGYDEFVKACMFHNLLIKEHPTLTAIRNGDPILRETADCLAQYISRSIGKPVAVKDFLDVSSDDEDAKCLESSEKGRATSLDFSESHQLSRGPIADAAIADLRTCFSNWPELVAQIQKAQSSASHPVDLLLAQDTLSAMLDNVLHVAVNDCLAGELKSGIDISRHWDLAKNILGNLCILEVSPQWLAHAQSQSGASASVLEVSVETPFGVEVVRAGRWGGMARFCDIKERTVPIGKHAILFDADADEAGASNDVAVEKVLRSVWSRVFPAPGDALPADLRLVGDSERLKALNRALKGERNKFRRYHHVPVNLRSSCFMALAGVRGEVARLVPELHVILWGTESSAGLPAFQGDETDAWNSVAEFLLIPSFLTDIQ